MKTLIIIPTHNEKENISELIDVIEKIITNTDTSILVVDDISHDGTIEAVEEKIQQYSNIQIIKRNTKLGLARAYIDGMKFGMKKGFEYFIQMDADFSHNPEYLPIIIEKLKTNDLVIGSRNIEGGEVKNWGFLRNLISKAGSLYSKIILNCPIDDLTGGFNGWKKEILEKINLDSIISKGYSFQIEMKYKAFINNAKITEFPIVFENRKSGKSKMSESIIFEALFNVIKIKLS